MSSVRTGSDELAVDSTHVYAHRDSRRKGDTYQFRYCVDERQRPLIQAFAVR